VGSEGLIPDLDLSNPDTLNDLYWAREKQRCETDFLYLAEHYLHLKAKDVIGFPTLKLNRVQRLLWSKIADQLKRTGRVRQVWGKPRQIGATTLCRGFCFQQSAFKDHRNGFLCTHDEPTSYELFDIDKTFYDAMPQELKPVKRYDPKHKMVFSGRNSKMVVGHARNMNVGASQMNHIVHLTEVARYPNPEMIQASLFPSISEATGADDFSIVIMESTAVFGGEWFKGFAEAAMAGENGYEFTFIPAHLHESYQRPVPRGFRRTFDEGEIQKQFKVTDAFLVWRRQEMAKYKTNPALFQQEFPLSWEQSWVLPKGTLRVFTDEYLQGMRLEIRPGTRMTPTSTGLQEQLGGPVEVWEAPQPGLFYDAGVDISEGATEKADWTVVEVTRRDTLEQVAELRLHINPATPEFVDLVYWIGAAYNFAQVNPDITGGWGAYLLTELQRRSYPNIWHWRRRDDARERVSSRLGFIFTQRDKAILVSNAVSLVTQGGLRIHSQGLLEELRNYLNIGLNEWAAAPGAYDDAVCVAEGTVVETSSGSAAIESLRIGESVLDHTGNYSAVTVAGSRVVTETVMLSITGIADPLVCTPNHRLLLWRARRGLGGWLLRGKHLLPWRETGEWVEAADVRPGDFLFVPKRRGLPKPPLDDDMLYLAGWYLGDGNLTPRGQLRVVLSLQEEECAERLAGIIRRVNESNPTVWIAGYGSRQHVRRRMPGVRIKRLSYERALSVETCNQWLARTLIQFCGPARHKRIAPELYESAGLLPLALGFLEADGSQRHSARGDIFFAQKDRFLLRQLRQVLLDSGVWCTEGGCSRRQELWGLDIGAPAVNRLLAMVPSEKFRPVERADHRVVAYETPTGYWTPVRATQRREGVVSVWNLKAVPAESYVAGGVATHNCAYMLALLSARDEQSGWDTSGGPTEEPRAGKPSYLVHDVAADLAEHRPQGFILEPWRV